MAISFDLPSEVEQRLRSEIPNLDQAAKELLDRTDLVRSVFLEGAAKGIEARMKSHT